MNTDALQSLFGCRVREWRERRGYTQEALAEVAALSVEYVSKIERGPALSSFAIIASLAEALDISPARLFDPNAGR